MSTTSLPLPHHPRFAEQLTTPAIEQGEYRSGPEDDQARAGINIPTSYLRSVPLRYTGEARSKQATIGGPKITSLSMYSASSTLMPHVLATADSI